MSYRTDTAFHAFLERLAVLALLACGVAGPLYVVFVQGIAPYN